MKYLIQKGDRVDLKDWTGKTALELASENRHDSTVKLLQTAAEKGEYIIGQLSDKYQPAYNKSILYKHSIQNGRINYKYHK